LQAAKVYKNELDFSSFSPQKYMPRLFHCLSMSLFLFLGAALTCLTHVLVTVLDKTLALAKQLHLNMLLALDS